MLLHQPSTNAYFERPYVRWWWLAGPFSEVSIASQLSWVRDNGFGGVELAWIHPSWMEEHEANRPRPSFLGKEWCRLIAFTKRTADELGLGCDFTFGSSWPFGGSWIGLSDAAQTFNGPSPQRLGGSWEASPKEKTYIVNHLSAPALKRYAEPLLQALGPALAGQTSALFCDSLEIATEHLWSPALWEEFASRFRYRLEPFAHNLQRRPAVRYDYRKLIGEVILREFYDEFTSICHTAEARSRVQCHGAPTDLLAAYAAADIPESEALLFLPPFSRIAASAAAWSGRSVVSAEAFTCIHGFPGWDDSADQLWKQERVGDLKLLADALFANGVNQIVWHGMPFRSAGGKQEFYASVHVGPDSSFASELPRLNEYFAQVCSLMRTGTSYCSLGVYLPLEDALMRDRIPARERTPGANYCWEMRHANHSIETRGFAPAWISAAFLKAANCIHNKVASRNLSLDALYIDCQWLDAEALSELKRLKDAGATIVWKQTPRQPGRLKNPGYKALVSELAAASASLSTVEPLLRGENIPPYWARMLDGELLLFFAHPASDKIRYPMPYRLSESAAAVECHLVVFWQRLSVPVQLSFGPNESLVIRISRNGLVHRISLHTGRVLET